MNLGERAEPVIELDGRAATDGGGTLAIVGAGSDNLLLAPRTDGAMLGRRVAVPVGANPSAVAALPDGRFVTADRLSDTLTFVSPTAAGGRGDAGGRARRRARRRPSAASCSSTAARWSRNNVADRAAVALHLRRLPRRRAHRRAAAPGQAEPVLLDDADLPRARHDRAVPAARQPGDHRRLRRQHRRRRTPRAPSAIREHFADYPVTLRVARRAGTRPSVTLSADGGARGAGALHGADPARAVAVRRGGRARAAPRRSARGPGAVPRSLRRLPPAGRQQRRSATTSPAAALERAAARRSGRADVARPLRRRDADPRRRREQPAVAARRVGRRALLQRRQRADARGGAPPDRPRAPTVHAPANAARPPAFSADERAALLAFLRAL